MSQINDLLVEARLRRERLIRELRGDTQYSERIETMHGRFLATPRNGSSQIESTVSIIH